MEDIKANLSKIKDTLPDGVTLITVTKTRTPYEINEAIDAGATDIGENKVQEIMDKYDSVKPVNWHLIGHLQTNKVKYIIDKVSMIHSVDSLKLAEEIDKRAGQKGIKMDILIQVNPAEEESKFGIKTDEIQKTITTILNKCYNIRIRGLMCVAPFAEDPKEVAMYFREIKEKFEEVKTIENENLICDCLSMGMSHDYLVAVEEGSNMVRVGSAIFGERVY